MFVTSGSRGGRARAAAATMVAGGVQRESLSADRTYYVRTDGSDSNNGLANSAGGAFLTIQHALDILADIDFRGKIVTIQVVDGTYTQALVIPGTVGQKFAGYLVIQGNTTTPSNVIITSASSSATVQNLHTGNKVRMIGVSLRNSGAGHGYRVADGAYGEFGKMHWGACGGAHIAVGQCSNCYIFDNFEIAGNATSHWEIQGNASLEIYSLTGTLTGTPAFSNGFVHVFGGGEISSGSMTFSGSATGARWKQETGGTIEIFGNNPNTYFPGNSNGTYDKMSLPPINAPASYAFTVTGINFNSANTDTTFTITLPAGFTRYRVTSVVISHASASITTATCGVFTGAGATGTAVVASGSAIAVSTASENTANNLQSLTVATVNTTSFNGASLFFRVQTAQGSAATADVTVTLTPLP